MRTVNGVIILSLKPITTTNAVWFIGAETFLTDSERLRDWGLIAKLATMLCSTRSRRAMAIDHGDVALITTTSNVPIIVS
jgi:hypothetical protein